MNDTKRLSLFYQKDKIIRLKLHTIKMKSRPLSRGILMQKLFFMQPLFSRFCASTNAWASSEIYGMTFKCSKKKRKKLDVNVALKHFMALLMHPITLHSWHSTWTVSWRGSLILMFSYQVLRGIDNGDISS